MLKKVLILFGMCLMLSCVACVENPKDIEPILGEDVVSNELIVDNTNYSYMKLELIKSTSYEKELCDSDKDGLYAEYYKVAVKINHIYTFLNLPLCNKGNSMVGYNKEDLVTFNQNLSANYYIDVPSKLINEVEQIDEVIMRVYAPIAAEYMLMPKDGSSLGYLSSHEQEGKIIKHNFYPIINGLVNIYTRTYEQVKYEKIYTNLDGFKYYDNGLKDRMTIDEFSDWIQNVYNVQKESELVNKNIPDATKNFQQTVQLGVEEAEDYTDNEGLVVTFSKLKEHSAMDGIEYALYKEGCYAPNDDLFPAQPTYAYSLVKLVKKDKYDIVKVDNMSYYVVDVELLETYECFEDYSIEYTIDKNNRYKTLDEVNNVLTKKYNILIKVDDVVLLNNMDSMIIRLFASGNYYNDALLIVRDLPAAGTSLATIDLNSTRKYYDYFPVKDDEVSVYTREYSDFTSEQVTTSLDDYNQYFYRALKDRMSVEEFKTFLSVVQKRRIERKEDYTNIFTGSY